MAFSARATDEDLDFVRSAVHDKLYPVAATHAEAYLQGVAARPADGVEALQLLLQALAEQHQYDQVLKRLEKWSAVVKVAPDAGVFEFWRALGLLGNGRPGACIETAEAALKQKTSPENADALKRLVARARLSLGEAPAALSMYAEVDKRSTNNATRAENLLEWANALETIGHVGEALGVLVRQVALNVTGPVTDEGRLAYGRLLARQQQPTEAEAAFRILGKNESATEFNRVQAWVEISQLALDGGRTNDAIAAAREAEKLATRAESSRLADFRLADLLLANAATLPEGVTRMKAYVRAFPAEQNASTAQFRLAEALLRHGSNEQAVVEYRFSLANFSDDHAREAAVHEGLGSALFRLGHYVEAANHFQMAHDRATNSLTRALCLFQAANALHDAGQFRQAAETYRRVYADYPASPLVPRALFQAADSLDAAHDNEGAQKAFELAALRCAPSDLAAQALLRLAVLQVDRRLLPKAIDTYAQALNLATNVTLRYEALMGRGHTHFLALHMDAAAFDFKAASETLPSRRDEAEYWRIMCLYDQDRYDDARAAALTFIGTFTNSPQLSEMIFMLGKKDYGRARFEDASRWLLQYATNWPDSKSADTAVLWAGQAFFRRADYPTAVSLMTRLQRDYPKSRYFAESLYWQGEALYKLGRFDDAMKMFNAIINRFADSDMVIPAWVLLGDSLFALGNEAPAYYEEARKAYGEALDKPLDADMRLHAEFKIGLCLQKQKKVDAAIDQYYNNVVLRYLADRQKGMRYADPESNNRFLNAASRAVDLLVEQKKNFDQAEAILNRVIQANVPGSEEARQRIQSLRKGPAGK